MDGGTVGGKKLERDGHGEWSKTKDLLYFDGESFIIIISM